LKSLKPVYFFILLLIRTNGFSQSGTQVEGERLFRDYCAACHKPGTELIGPDIKNIRDKRDKVWIMSFVQNSQKMILNNDKEAIKLFLDYKKVVMPANALDEKQITSILNYIDTVSHFNIFSDTSLVLKSKLAPVKNKPGFPVYSTILLLIIVLIALIIIISRLYLLKTLSPEQKLYNTLLSFDWIITKTISRSFYLLLLMIMIIDISLYLNKLAYFSTQEELVQISQPIWFSHETHYSNYKIQCLSCHKNALTNQFAGLPDVKSCMKCHTYIKNGGSYGQVEIVKIYKKYYAHEDVTWNEGYRLTQYVHFDHSLHTTTAKLSCTDCHTNQTHIEVSKLEFKMAWCISCHQIKKLDVSNKYYLKNYDSAFISKIPGVANSGGIDCSKCHY
jgi:hypothetical protein